jgi:phosphohistidine phosphatase
VELLLVRHAIAFERDAKRWRDDGARTLSPRGKARARRAAAGLKYLVERPTLLLTSPLTRTRETAAILSTHARWPSPTDCAQLVPGSDPAAFLATVRDSAQPRVAAIGHEPDLGRLLEFLLHGDAAQGRYRFKKMGAALVQISGRPRPGSATLLWFAPPRLLRAAG